MRRRPAQSCFKLLQYGKQRKNEMSRATSETNCKNILKIMA
eukprot:07305.XXX_347414_347536_1 [CDS] Oithona nana genome sequencing.